MFRCHSWRLEVAPTDRKSACADCLGQGFEKPAVAGLASVGMVSTTAAKALSVNQEFVVYDNCSIRRSPTRKAFAIIVSAGLTLALDGKKLPSTT